MQHDHDLELARENSVLTVRVDGLTRALARAEAVSQLTAGVVHDLRNAFQVVLSTGRALAQVVADPAQRELLTDLLEAGEHAAGLAYDLLAVARSEDSRSASLNPGEFLSGFKHMAERVVLKRVKLVFEVEPGVWDVMVERRQLEAALINLSVNARDAMQDGGELTIGARNLPLGAALPSELEPGDYTEFFVRDTGSGMSPAVLAHATEAFFTTKEASGGTGLGLAMVQAFANRSGGALRIESKSKHGTRVGIVLPRLPSPRPALGNEEEDARLERVLRPIRTPWLREALISWRDACSPHALPRPLAAEARLAAHAENTVVFEVDEGVLRLSRMGAELADVLGRSSLDDVPIAGATGLGSLAGAYRRALQSRFPSYEYANYGLGDGVRSVFERLILPAANDGQHVSHLIGAIQISGIQHSGGRSHDETERVK
jgi:nitrogen-specific signal transduction histidine kinase